MRKCLLILIVGLLVSSCSIASESSFQPERPTLVPTKVATATPVIEICFVDIKTIPVQMSFTGADIQEYCAYSVEIYSDSQEIGSVQLDGPEACTLEIDPGVYLTIRSTENYTYWASELCEIYSNNLASSTPTP